MSEYRYRCPWIVPTRYGDGSGIDLYGAKSEADARALVAHLRSTLRPGVVVLEPVEAATVWAALEQLAKGATA